MSTNYLAQSHPSQVWSWKTSMDPLHHHHQMEHMFEKPLTPSDVGKLNRLVIPKQNAEKYFPMAGGESGEKGLLLNFEDESGKAWRFRYSYWTSSQSYVLTKGWSRFVKEKRLDAGDVVLFRRHRGDNSLYIGCRRRGDAAQTAEPALLPWSPVFYAAATTSHAAPSCYCINPMQHAATDSTSDSAAAAGKPGKRLRLFGVNLECGPEI